MLPRFYIGTPFMSTQKFARIGSKEKAAKHLLGLKPGNANLQIGGLHHAIQGNGVRGLTAVKE